MLGNVVNKRRGKAKPDGNQKKSPAKRNLTSKTQVESCQTMGKKKEATCKITDYFPVRRSNRKTTKELEAEKIFNIESLIRSGSNEKYLGVCDFKDKGRGIRALRSFEKDEFVVEYKGEIISYKEAKIREDEYGKDSKIGSYMYFFRHRGSNFCVDATEEKPFKGRLINHSMLKPNLKTKVVDFGDSFHLIFVAKRNLEVGEELLYDYGDRTPCTVAQNQWLMNT
uniref:[histone H4]-lysine(20) N-methyltransferase n=1 Tax=Ditylenchus dipsaci TaxID=166011 RepID=A0A915DFH0_9BILA